MDEGEPGKEMIGKKCREKRIGTKVLKKRGRRRRGKAEENKEKGKSGIEKGKRG